MEVLGREIPIRAGYNLEKATRIDRMRYVQTNLTFALSFIRGQSFMANKKILVLAFQKRFNEAGLLISATVVWLGAVVIITVFYRWLLINVL